MSLFNGRRALFISYNGMLDPLGQSQVIPYLKELGRLGVKFTLLSFERPPAFTLAGQSLMACLRAELAAHEIEWHWLRYHQKPSLPATIYDVWQGVRYAGKLARKNNIELVHARSHIPATIALSLKRRFGLKMIFDLRGLMAEEYVDSGHWRAGSLPVRITKTMERRALAATDGLVTLTTAIWDVVKDWEGLRGRTFAHQVVPCCADLEVFRFDETARVRIRDELNVQNRFVIVYSGSIDGWYLTEAMADFFVSLSRIEPGCYFLWLTSRADRIHALMTARGFDKSHYSIHSVPTRQVASYLSAADAGLAFIKPCFSKLASSPTKTAEYLACGLPLVLNAGVGDSDILITGEKAGVLVTGFSSDEYDRAAKTLLDMSLRAEENRILARGLAERLFDVHQTGVKRYAALYRDVLAGENYR